MKITKYKLRLKLCQAQVKLRLGLRFWLRLMLMLMLVLAEVQVQENSLLFQERVVGWEDCWLGGWCGRMSNKANHKQS